MSSNSKRDEMLIDRLSSFLYREGKLDTSKIVPIKSNVFHLKTVHDREIILKKHNKKDVVEQQWKFFDKTKSSIIIPFQRFPNGIRLIKSNGTYWTISPFVKGKKLNFSKVEDRNAGLNTIRQFHGKTKGINIPSPIKRQLLHDRWYNRLHSFKKTRHIFYKYGFENLYEDIVQTTEAQLLTVAQLSWGKLEREAEMNWEWIHGDVASHNFIRGKNIYMIDFDLLSQSPQLYDYIQLGQRFLPHINWDINTLLSYRMVDDDKFRLWILTISIPSDVLREWLHFLLRSTSTSIYRYLTNMDNDWIKRQDFLKNVTSMLKLY